MGWREDLTKGIGALADRYTDDDDTISWTNVGKDALMASAAYAALNPNDSETLNNFMGTNQQMPVGYMGGIPNYTASRELLPDAFAPTYTDPTTQEVTPRRPGSAGRRYFTDTTFVQSTDEPTMGRTAEDIARENQQNVDNQAIYESLMGDAFDTRVANEAAGTYGSSDTTGSAWQPQANAANNAEGGRRGTAENNAYISSIQNLVTANPNMTAADLLLNYGISPGAGYGEFASVLPTDSPYYQQLYGGEYRRNGEFGTFDTERVYKEAFQQNPDATIFDTSLGREVSLFNEAPLGGIKAWDIDNGRYQLASTPSLAEIRDQYGLDTAIEASLGMIQDAGYYSTDFDETAEMLGVDVATIRALAESRPEYIITNRAENFVRNYTGDPADFTPQNEGEQLGRKYLGNNKVEYFGFGDIIDEASRIGPQQGVAYTFTADGGLAMAEDPENPTGWVYVASEDSFISIKDGAQIDNTPEAILAARESGMLSQETADTDLDAIAEIIREGSQTPAQAAIAAGISEEELIVQLIRANETNFAEVAAYYQDQGYPGITAAEVEGYYNNILQERGEFAQGGNVNGYYLGGPTDGMADQIPATIDNSQPAALSDGEFVIPADIVSHLGNGNSEAGAESLYSMMERVRTDRTGNPNQGRQIDPNKYLA